MICNTLRTSEQVFGKLPKIPKKEMAKILLLTHTDMDGEGANIMLQNTHTPYDIEVRRLSNGTMSFEIGRVFIEDESKNYDFIIAADISCSEKVCQIIARHRDANKFVILDHHCTSDYLNNYPFAICQSALLFNAATTEVYKSNTLEAVKNGTIELHSSGTSLMLDYLNWCDAYEDVSEKRFKILVELAHIIRSYDTWDWHNHLNDWKICNDLCLLFDAYGAENFVKKIHRNIFKHLHGPKDEMDDILDSLMEDEDIFLDDNDLFILECEANKADSFVNSVKKSYRTGNLKLENENGIKFYSVVYTCANKYLQQVFEDMKKDYADTDLYLINYGSGIALRTQNEAINLGELAVNFGGGGHKQAAGFKIPSDRLDAFISSEVFNDCLMLDEKED